MSLRYQTLSGYKGQLYGQPKYNGLEYDWEVPDSTVIASPGGVSTVHHHPSKGFNGRGNSSSDVYAGQGQRYISGSYGNLYQPGQQASDDQGMFSKPPDYQFWQNQEPQTHSYTQSMASEWDPYMKPLQQPGMSANPQMSQLMPPNSLGTFEAPPGKKNLKNTHQIWN